MTLFFIFITMGKTKLCVLLVNWKKYKVLYGVCLAPGKSTLIYWFANRSRWILWKKIISAVNLCSSILYDALIFLAHVLCSIIEWQYFDVYSFFRSSPLIVFFDIVQRTTQSKKNIFIYYFKSQTNKKWRKYNIVTRD